MDPVHFALIGITSLAFGLVTPPYGLCLLIASAIGEIPLRKVIRDVSIMLVPLLFVLGTLILFPEIYLFLPRLLGPEAAP
jgi:TRAP-type C4-dicarboxylate transport system permease large subunit